MLISAIRLVENERKRLLHIDEYPEPEFRNYFVCGDFQDTQYDRECSVMDDLVGIIRNEIYFVNFTDV